MGVIYQYKEYIIMIYFCKTSHSHSSEVKGVRRPIDTTSLPTTTWSSPRILGTMAFRIILNDWAGLNFYENDKGAKYIFIWLCLLFLPCVLLHDKILILYFRFFYILKRNSPFRCGSIPQLDGYKYILDLQFSTKFLYIQRYRNSFFSTKVLCILST